MEKQSDIVILKSMGAIGFSIMYIFMVEGLIIGMIGIAVGGIIGSVICWVVDHY